MKKIVISVLAAVFITIIIPLLIVEVFSPRENAVSSEAGASAETVVGGSVTEQPGDGDK